jgi:hypothetical protein
VKVKFDVFLTKTLDGDGSSASRSGQFISYAHWAEIRPRNGLEGGGEGMLLGIISCQLPTT